MDGERKLNIKNIVLAVLLVLFSALLVFSIIKLTDALGGDEDELEHHSRVIERNGIRYYPKTDITTLLVIGTDSSGEVKESSYHSNDARADFVLLMIFNNTEKTYTVLNINRDTMLKMPVIGADGKNAGEIVGQLALSHTYGSGLGDSCENTKKAVSDLLYGLDINYYASFNMSAISYLNDAVGGVTVNVTDDFSAVDPSIPMGKVTLTGEQAFSYVRSRKGLGDQLNISRMNRQEEYMKGFVDAFGAKYSGNESSFLSLYDSISPYTVTDCSSTILSEFATRYSKYDFKGVMSLEGENNTENEFIEFYPNKDKLDEYIIKYLYSEA